MGVVLKARDPALDRVDAIKVLSEISSKVDQVRGDLPPEAEVPVINVESADSRFASAYLSFTSDMLQQNQITDYLVRVVQPRGDHLGRRHVFTRPGVVAQQARLAIQVPLARRVEQGFDHGGHLGAVLFQRLAGLFGLVLLIMAFRR